MITQRLLLRVPYDELDMNHRNLATQKSFHSIGYILISDHSRPPAPIDIADTVPDFRVFVTISNSQQDGARCGVLATCHPGTWEASYCGDDQTTNTRDGRSSPSG